MGDNVNALAMHCARSLGLVERDAIKMIAIIALRPKADDHFLSR
jgi:hypothetical protein